MKYLKDCDLIVYDLHAGNPLDVELALEALRPKKKKEEGEEPGIGGVRDQQGERLSRGQCLLICVD